MRAPSRARLRLVTVIVASVAGLAIGEGLLRLIRPWANMRDTTALRIYAPVPDPDLVWGVRKDMRVTRKWVGRTIVIRTDEHGRRISDDPPPVNHSGTLAFAGDSYVFGNEVNAEETFAYLVGQSLGMRSVNLGIGAYRLSQECAALRGFMSQETGISHAFLVIYIGNDIEGGAFPPKGLRADDEGYLFEGEPGLWSTIKAFLGRNSHLVFFGSRAIRLNRPAERGFTGLGWGRRWMYDERAYTPDRLADHARVLTGLRDEARRRQVPLTVVLMPEREQLYGPLSDLPNHRISAMLSELGMAALDLLPSMRMAAAERNLWHRVIGGHLSPDGHRVAAEVLVARLRAGGLPAASPASAVAPPLPDVSSPRP